MRARILKLLNCAFFVTLALGLSPARGMAREVFKGSFTLPFQVQWGGKTLPAGDYTIDLHSFGDPFLIVRGGGKSAYVLKGVADMKPTSNHSQLTVVNAGGRKIIKSLEAGQIGFIFKYPVPKPTTKSMENALIPVRKANDAAGGI